MIPTGCPGLDAALGGGGIPRGKVVEIYGAESSGQAEIGLQQLDLLDDQYRQLGVAAVGIADPLELRERLRMDPSLRYATSAEIVTNVEFDTQKDAWSGARCRPR